MLVASCNNVDVENITKELPDGVALLKGIEPGKKEDGAVCQGLRSTEIISNCSVTIDVRPRV